MTNKYDGPKEHAKRGYIGLKVKNVEVAATTVSLRARCQIKDQWIHIKKMQIPHQTEEYFLENWSIQQGNDHTQRTLDFLSLVVFELHNGRPLVKDTDIDNFYFRQVVRQGYALGQFQLKISMIISSESEKAFKFDELTLTYI